MVLVTERVELRLAIASSWLGCGGQGLLGVVARTFLSRPEKRKKLAVGGMSPERFEPLQGAQKVSEAGLDLQQAGKPRESLREPLQADQG